MKKLDGKFYGDIFKAKDHTRVPDDQYIVFLIKDNAFAAILPEYRKKCAELGCDDRQLFAIDRLINRVNQWRADNSSLLKKPDIEEMESFINEEGQLSRC